MSRNIIFVLMYHHHKLLDPNKTPFPNMFSIDAWLTASDLTLDFVYHKMQHFNLKIYYKHETIIQASENIKLVLQWNWVLWSILLGRVTLFVFMRQLKATVLLNSFIYQFRVMFINYNIIKHMAVSANRSQMKVISSLCISLGSSTVQLHDGLGSRRACTSSEASFSTQNGDCA
jgi:hypothetical protein